MILPWIVCCRRVFKEQSRGIKEEMDQFFDEVLSDGSGGGITFPYVQYDLY